MSSIKMIQRYRDNSWTITLIPGHCWILYIVCAKLYRVLSVLNYTGVSFVLAPSAAAWWQSASTGDIPWLRPHSRYKKDALYIWYSYRSATCVSDDHITCLITGILILQLLIAFCMTLGMLLVQLMSSEFSCSSRENELFHPDSRTPA
jgi:hypothetical protein